MDASVVFPAEADEMCSSPADHTVGEAEVGTAHKLSASVLFPGETAEKRSGLAGHMSISVGEAEVGTAHKLSGETATKRSVGEAVHELSSPPEHPRLARLRHRRLIAFLRDQGFHDSYNELTNKTRAHMSLRHLRGLVERGRWLDAVEYLDRYLPPPTSPKSFRAQVLRHFLVMHHRFANAVDGIVDKAVPRNYLQLNNGRTISHADLRLRSISFSILAVDQVRANMNWETVRRKASLVVSRLARSTRELRVYIALPATSIKPHHVLPIASGLSTRRRYVKKKQTGRPEDIVRALKSQQLMVPRIGSVEEAKELLADLLDETVRGGVRLSTYGLNRPLQPGTNEGAQLCQPMFGTSTEAITSRTLLNAGAQFCQPMFGTSTEAKTSRTLANAGAQLCQPMFGTSIEAITSGTLLNAGAQFCQPMFGTSTEAKTSRTLANAGTNQLVVEAGFHTNTARQDLDGRKSLREETIVKLKCQHEQQLKRQRLTGTFGEASPVVSGPGAVVNLGAKLSGVSSG